MKKQQTLWACIIFVLGLIFILHAQETATPVQEWTNDVSSLSDLQIEEQAIEMTTPVAATNEPLDGTFYSAQNPDSAPAPENVLGVPVWPVGNGFYLLDDLDVDYSAPRGTSLARGGLRAMDSIDPGDPGDGSGDGGIFSPMFSVPDYSTNLWLEITNLTVNTAGILISNTEPDIKYEIQGIADLTDTNWISEGFVLGSEITNWTPTSVAATNYPNLFLRVRSWIDSDNVGIPDWWQLQYFGYVGIDPYAASPAGDGFTIWQKYQNGLNPNNFETPPAPDNFVAVLSTNGTDALLSWNTAQGSVMNYAIVRGVFNFDTFEYDYSSIGTVNGGTTSFTDVGAVTSDEEVNPVYKLTAVYQGGNSSQTAFSFLFDTAPAPPIPPTPTYNISVAATLVRNATGRWQLMFTDLSANAQTIQLIWGNGATENVLVISLTNGIYQISDADSVNHLGDTISVQGMNTNEQAGAVVSVGTLPNDAPYFVDGRRHMKQNLNFLIRAASLNASFASSYVDPTVGEFNQATTNFEEFSFLHHGSWNGGADEDLSSYQLDNLWPFTANYYLDNFFVDTSRTNFGQSPYGVTNFNFTPNFATNIPAPPILTTSPYWILQPSFNYFGNETTNWGITISDTNTVTSLENGINNLFGLPFETGWILDVLDTVDPGTGLPADAAIYQPLAPGGSVTVEDQEDGYILGIYASQCAAPTLILSNYFFAPLFNPNDNPMGLPGSYNNFFNYSIPNNRGIQPFTPLEDDFAPTNQTPPLIIGAVGQPMIIAGWAKYSIQESSPTKFGYLGQYFMTNAFLLYGSGNVTTNSAGILSPYGEFFPIQAGQAQLITMPDIDTGQQGTCTVSIVSLNVDANHDGTMDLSYFGQDQTSPSKPYVFWCNNNFDRTHRVDDGNDIEEDDVPQWDADIYNLDPGDDDANYMVSGVRQIPCARDLEDFSRLWINGVTSNLLAALPSGSTVTLSWGDVGSPNPNNPTIDLFTAADADGGTGYLTNSTTAALQINQSLYPYVNRLAPGNSIQLNTFQFDNNWAGNHFIWCGVKNGSGKLTLSFEDASGNVLGQASVYIQIQDIKQMYERWTVGDNTTQPPATTAHPAGDLPTDMTQSFSYTTLATTNTPYVLFVHGWNMNTWEKDRYAETELKRLYWQGYQGRFGEFRWPTYFNFPFEAFEWQAADLDNFDNSELNAWKSGPGLLNLLTSLNAEYPGQVYLTAHSMGNVVAGEALRLASSQVVNTYIAMQGAISAHAYDPTTANRVISDYPDDYAQYWTNGAPCYFNGSAGAGTYVNFFNTNDFALNADNWQLDQNNKPDTGYGYNFTFNIWQHLLSTLSYTDDRYAIFAYCDPSLSYALGAQVNVNGAFHGNQIELDIAPYNFDIQHKYHSGEFRSDNAQRWQFWNQVLVQMKLK